jgi:starch-binding outer membrane protein, SusD/RagB family
MLTFKLKIMKHYKIFLTSAFMLATISSCKKSYFEVDTELDPNAPPVSAYIANATPTQIRQMGVGLQGVMRNAFLDFGRITSSVGREVINSASTDNRYYTELLGTNTAQYTGTAAGANDPAGIFNTYYAAYSQTRRRAEQFILSAQNTSSITAAQKKAIEGFARTVQAYVTLNLANMQGKNGIRETFTDLLNPGDQLKPGKFGTYASALVVCKKYVDDGLAALNAAGTGSFPFTMNSGWTGFNTIDDFKKFNRAVAARIAMYQGDWPGVLTNLNLSFLDLTGNLKTGPNFIFSTAANDITNGLFHVPNSSGAPFVVFDEVIAAAEAGDTRIFGPTAKVAARTDARQSGAFTSTHEVVMFTSNTSSASIIRNEELVLMYAEASAQTSAFGNAKTALDLIRTTYGLPAYSGALTQPAMIDEVLKQRRFSLFFEGHRWFDMRRYNRLAQITPQGTISGNTYVVFEAMSRPDAEVQWDKLYP